MFFCIFRVFFSCFFFFLPFDLERKKKTYLRSHLAVALSLSLFSLCFFVSGYEKKNVPARQVSGGPILKKKKSFFEDPLLVKNLASAADTFLIKVAARCSPPPLPPERHQDRICKKTIRRRARSLRTRRESGAKKKGKERAHTRAAAGAASTQARALHFPLPFERAQLCIKSSGVRIVCDLRRPVGERL